MFISQIKIAVTGHLTSHMLGVTVGFLGALLDGCCFGVSIAMQNVNAELQELPPQRSQHSDHSVHRSKAFSNPAWVLVAHWHQPFFSGFGGNGHQKMF